MLNKQMMIMTGLTICLTACATAQENPNYEYSSRQNSDEVTQTASDSGVYQAQNATYRDGRQTGTTTYDRHRDFTNSRSSGAAVSDRVVTSEGAPRTTLPSYQIQTSSPATPDTTSPQTYQGYTPYSMPQSTSQTTAPRTQTAPTDNAYAGRQVTGTPGYGVYVPEATPSQPAYQPPQPTYQPQRTIQASGPSSQPSYSQPSYSQPSSGPQPLPRSYAAPTSQAPQNPIAAYTPIDDPARYLPVQRVQTGPILSGNYQVKQGDTVYSLSRSLCVGIEDIQRANRLNADFAIQIGQSLALPSSRC